MDAVTREIRQMLLGNLEPKGKYLAVSENRLTSIHHGVSDGADTVFLLGVRRHARYYVSSLSKGKIKESAHKALMDIGRKVLLQSNPEAETVICRYMVTKPIVVLFEIDDIGIKVETYTARGISGLISETWIRWRFMRKMPDELKPVNKEVLKARLKEEDEKRKSVEEQQKAEKKKVQEEKKKVKEEAKQGKNEAKLIKKYERQARAEYKKRMKEEAAALAREEALRRVAEESAKVAETETSSAEEETVNAAEE